MTKSLMQCRLCWSHDIRLVIPRVTPCTLKNNLCCTSEVIHDANVFLESYKFQKHAHYFSSMKHILFRSRRNTFMYRKIWQEYISAEDSSNVLCSRIARDCILGEITMSHLHRETLQLFVRRVVLFLCFFAHL